MTHLVDEFQGSTLKVAEQMKRLNFKKMDVYLLRREQFAIFFVVHRSAMFLSSGPFQMCKKSMKFSSSECWWRIVRLSIQCF